MAGDVPEPEHATAGMPDEFQTQAAQEFADDVAGGRMSSIRAIRARLHVGQARARLVCTCLATLAEG